VRWEPSESLEHRRGRVLGARAGAGHSEEVMGKWLDFGNLTAGKVSNGQILG
jgi:hypothetical protein